MLYSGCLSVFTFWMCRKRHKACMHLVTTLFAGCAPWNQLKWLFATSENCRFFFSFIFPEQISVSLSFKHGTHHRKDVETTLCTSHALEYRCPTLLYNLKILMCISATMGKFPVITLRNYTLSLIVA